MKLTAMNEIESIKNYIERIQEVSFCFLFGSRSKGLNRTNSDYDIGVYFKPVDTRTIEFENVKEYLVLDKIWNDLELLLKREVDLVVLNNAPAHLASIIITRGIPIIIKDEKLFFSFLSVTTSNAIDYREFVRDYYNIYNRSASLSEIDKTNLRKILIFLENEMEDYNIFKNLSWSDYERDRNKRRNIERWVENIVNSIIDISKILLASERIPIPETYRELIIKLKLLGIEENKSIDKVASWTKLRNILAHEYLDIRWTPIKNFTNDSQHILISIIDKLKEKIG